MQDAKAVEPRIDKLKKRYRCEHELDEVLSNRLRRREMGSQAWAGVSDVHVRLENFIKQHIKEPFTISDVARLSGGGANESYSFTLTHGNQSMLVNDSLAWKPGDRLVLRVKQPGGICPVDAKREFQMLKVASKIMPVPKPYWLADDISYFGAPAFIYAHSEGTNVPTKNAPKATGLGVAYGKNLREKLAPQFMDYYSRLHSYDWSKEELNGFDIPRPNTTDAVDWRVDFWSRSWDQDKIEPHPAVMLMKEWLNANRPKVDTVSLLHGDFRNGNFLFDEETGEIKSVVDWELCSLGDRHSDLAYTMLPGWGSYDETGTFLVAGLMDTETFISEYERISGLKIDPERLKYYYVLNYYWAVISLIGTGPKNAECELTLHDVMYNFISGLGGRFCADVNKIILEN
jgi:aminoglycoside phosphotransferase (APT) family kinase protein